MASKKEEVCPSLVFDRYASGLNWNADMREIVLLDFLDFMYWDKKEMSRKLRDYLREHVRSICESEGE